MYHNSSSSIKACLAQVSGLRVPPAGCRHRELLCCLAAHSALHLPARLSPSHEDLLGNRKKKHFGSISSPLQLSSLGSRTGAEGRWQVGSRLVAGCCLFPNPPQPHPPTEQVNAVISSFQAHGELFCRAPCGWVRAFHLPHH